MAESARAPGVVIDLEQPASDGDDEGTSSPRAVVSGETSAGSSAVRKPRGRPPGSKNKPKQPVVVSRGSPSAMHPMALQFGGGFDIISGLSDYVRRHRVGVSVIGASGVVSGVSLRHASLVHGLEGVFTVQGRFDILSLSGMLFPPSAARAPPPPPLTVSLATSRGKVIGGFVMGSLPAAGPVLIMVVTFVMSEFHRLPISEDNEAAVDDNEAAVEDEDEDDDGADPVTPLAPSLRSTLIDLNALPVELSPTGIVLLPAPAAPPPSAARTPSPAPPPSAAPLLTPSDI